MADYTRFTNLEVTGDLKANFSGKDADDFTVTAADAAVAAGSAPTKAEFDAVVTLANANKAAINALVAALISD